MRRTRRQSPANPLSMRVAEFSLSPRAIVFVCHHADEPLCHESRGNSACAKGHPAQPIRQRFARQLVAHPQIENVGAERLQFVFEKCACPPVPQSLSELRSCARWGVSPLRQPIKNAPLTFREWASFPPPVCHRARGNPVFRRQLAIGRSASEAFPRSQFVAGRARPSAQSLMR